MSIEQLKLKQYNALMPYFIPVQSLETTFEAKKSLFHARAALAQTHEEAFEVLNQSQRSYPDARHHCWAYLLGSPQAPVSLAMSDDGEPTGTAGKPILNILQHNNVGNVMMVVSRYFGGIKLGAGGLIRAYAAATQQTLRQLPVRQQVTLIAVRVQTDFKHEQLFHHFVASRDGHIDTRSYAEGVTIELSIPEIHITELRDYAANVKATIRMLKPHHD